MSQILVTGEAKIRDIQGPVVANDGVITALDGAASQYVRGDGTLADFPSSSGGGSSVSYYLNSSVSQGTIGGVAYRELSKDPIIGAGTDIAISANGYVASYITDANDPDVTIVPGGNFNCEFYFSVNNNTGNPFTYAELYKYDGTTFTLLGSSIGVPEYINQGTIIAPYYFAIPVPTSSLALTDRLAIRIYVNVDGRVVTLHTENSHLCQVVTTFSKGMVSLNNLTDQSQFITTGTSGTNFNIVSSGDTHTFNLPVASATNTGKLSNTDWSTFNNKVPYTGATANVDLGLYEILAQNAFLNGVSGINGGNLFLRQDIDFGQSAGYTTLYSSGKNLGFVSYVGSYTYNALFSLNSLTNNSTRTYTLPDLSGTLALLEGTQTFSGAKTFSGLASFTNTSGINLQYGAYINKGNTPLAFSSGTTNIYSDATTNNIVIRDNSSIAKLEFNNSTQTYTFPAASGTIALTSNLSAYLPLTGGTLTGALSGTSATFSGLGTFNQLTITGATAGRIFYAQTGGVVSQSGNLNWNETNGMLGVGTPNPSAVITAFSTNAATQFKAAGTAPAFTFSNTLTSPTLGCVFGLATASNHFVTGTAAGDMAIANQSTVAGAIVFGTGTTERMRMSAAGRFLINTSVDNGASLQVNGAATFSSSVTAASYIGEASTTELRLRGGGYGGSYNTSLRSIPGAIGVLQFGNNNDNYILVGNTAAGGYLSIRVNVSSESTTSGIEAMRITSGGNVGIGTSIPAEKLDVIGGALAAGNGTIRTGITYSSLGLIGTFTNHDLGIITNGTERMRITSGGNVGIGNTGGSSTRLSVTAASANAGIRIDADSGQNALSIGGTGNISVDYPGVGGGRFQLDGNGNVYNRTGVYGTISDIKFKENIINATPKLSDIMKLKVRNFNLIGDDNKQVGFIAQEFEEVFPSMVGVGGNKKDGTYKAIKTSVLTPILVKGLQELKAEKDAEIAELKAQIEELKALTKLQNTQVKQQSVKITKLEELISKRK